MTYPDEIKEAIDGLELLLKFTKNITDETFQNEIADSFQENDPYGIAHDIIYEFVHKALMMAQEGKPKDHIKGDLINIKKTLESAISGYELDDVVTEVRLRAVLNHIDSLISKIE